MNRKKITGIALASIVGVLSTCGATYLVNQDNKNNVSSASLISEEVQGVAFSNHTSMGITKDNDWGEYSLIELPVYEEINSNFTPVSRGAISRKSQLNFLKTVEEVAGDVILGLYGDGEDRRVKLESEGYNYEEVQREVARQKSPQKEPAQEVALTNKVIKAFPHKTFKSYMPWTALSKSSPQGKLAAKAQKDPSTAIMKLEGRYLVALGSAYASYVGEKIDVILESGQVIPVIVGDFKADIHTDKNNSTTLHDGSAIEFIVSSNNEAAKATNRSGSYNTLFPGLIKEFRK